MALQHFMVTRDMLSDYAVSLLDPDRPWKPSKKLGPNLLNNTKYVAHYRNLHGLVITKIHRFLSFTQRPWLKPWIDQRNEQRKAARSEFESDLAKLQANTPLARPWSKSDCLIADPNKLLKAVAKVSCQKSDIINQVLVMVRGAWTKITLNKPIAVGFSIFLISKFIMYYFCYDRPKAKYAERCTLLFTDTDSLSCEIPTDDLYADMTDILDLYDTSSFDQKVPQC